MTLEKKIDGVPIRKLFVSNIPKEVTRLKISIIVLNQFSAVCR